MRIILITLLSAFSLQGYSSTNDSLRLVPDSPRISLSKVNFKAGKAIRYIPFLLIGYGLTSLDNKIVDRADKHFQHELMEEYPNFSTHIDDGLQYAPLIAVYGLNVSGIKSRSNLFDRSVIYLLSNSLMGLSVNFLKDKTDKLRPSRSDRRSFPSGHTATAFVAAEFMRQEYKDVSPWYGYAGYSMAAATGALRMLNNKHWLSDVLAGAGIGILSTKFSYYAYPWIKKKIIKNSDLNFIAMPVVQKGITGCAVIVPL